MSERREIHVDARYSQPVRGREVQRAPARSDSQIDIDIDDSAGLRRCQLESRQMDDVTPDQDRIAGRFDQPRRVAGRMPRQGHRRHAGKHSTITDRPDALAIGSNSSPRRREECLRWLGRARARIFIIEKVQLGLVDNKLRTRKTAFP